MKKPALMRLSFEVTTEACLKDKLTEEENSKSTGTLRNLNSVFVANHFIEIFYSYGELGGENVEETSNADYDKNMSRLYSTLNDKYDIRKDVALKECDKTINTVIITADILPQKLVREIKCGMELSKLSIEEVVKLTATDRLNIIKSFMAGMMGNEYITAETSIGKLYIMPDSLFGNFTPIGTRLLKETTNADYTDTELNFTTYSYNAPLTCNKRKHPVQ